LRKTASIFEFSVKRSIRNIYFPPCAKNKLHFVFHSEICKYTHFDWHKKKTVGDGEKLLTYLNSALKVLSGEEIFPRGTKKLNFVDQCILSVSHREYGGKRATWSGQNENYA
jgi:hypothetical protein